MDEVTKVLLKCNSLRFFLKDRLPSVEFAQGLVYDIEKFVRDLVKKHEDEVKYLKLRVHEEQVLRKEDKDHYEEDLRIAYKCGSRSTPAYEYPVEGWEDDFDSRY